MIIETERITTTEVSDFDLMMMYPLNDIRIQIWRLEQLDKTQTVVERFRYQDPASCKTIIGIKSIGLENWAK